MTSLAHFCPVTEAPKKPSLVFSAGLCTITWGQKNLRSGFPRMSRTSFPKKKASIFSGLNPLDFGIWSYLESIGLSPSKFGSLKVKLLKDWAEVLQKVIRDTCKLYSPMVSGWRWHRRWGQLHSDRHRQCWAKPHSYGIANENRGFFKRWLLFR